MKSTVLHKLSHFWHQLQVQRSPDHPQWWPAGCIFGFSQCSVIWGTTHRTQESPVLNITVLWKPKDTNQNQPTRETTGWHLGGLQRSNFYCPSPVDALPSWYIDAWQYLYYYQPGKLTWTLVTILLIGAYLRRQDWWNHWPGDSTSSPLPIPGLQANITFT